MKNSAKAMEFREKLRAMLAAAVVITAVLALILACTPAGDSFWQDVCWSIGMGDWRNSRELLELHFLDVGKADAILIKSRGHAALLDSGNYVTAGQVSDYLSRYGVEKLDYLIMSHSDRDHMGGMAQIASEIEVAAFVQAKMQEPVTPENQEYTDLQGAIEKLGIKRIALAPGESVKLGAAELKALGPMLEYDNANDASLVLRLICGDFSALFCGDMEAKAEKDLLESGQELSSNLLKVGHHGSKTSSSEEFIRAVSPQWAVICVGPDRNNLPRQEILVRLEKAGALVFRTDLDGTLRFVYEGENKIRLDKDRK